jgi:hypothetical protein
MILKPAISLMLVLLIATPAFAAHFYIVQDTAKKTCTVVKGMPTSKTLTIVDEGRLTFKTHAKAEARMTKLAACRSS